MEKDKVESVNRNPELHLEEQKRGNTCIIKSSTLDKQVGIMSRYTDAQVDDIPLDRNTHVQVSGKTLGSVNRDQCVPVNENILESVKRGTDAQVDSTLESVNRDIDGQVNKGTFEIVNSSIDVHLDDNMMDSICISADTLIDGNTLESAKRDANIQMDEDTLESVNESTNSQVTEYTLESVNISTEVEVDEEKFGSVNKSTEVQVDSITMDSRNKDPGIQIGETTIESVNRSTDAEVLGETMECVNLCANFQEAESKMGSVSRNTNVQVDGITIADVEKCTNVILENMIESINPRTDDQADKNTMESVKICTDGQADEIMQSLTDIQVGENMFESVNGIAYIQGNENMMEILNIGVKGEGNIVESMNIDIDKDTNPNRCDSVQLAETSTENKGWYKESTMAKNMVEGVEMRSCVKKEEGLVDDVDARQHIKIAQHLSRSEDWCQDIELDDNITENVNTCAEFESGTDEAVHSLSSADVTLETGMKTAHEKKNKNKEPVILYDALRPLFIVGSIIGLHTLSRKAEGKYIISPVKVFVAALGLAHSCLAVMEISFTIFKSNSYYTLVMLLPMQSGCGFCFHAYLLWISKSKHIGKYLSAIEENQLKIRIPCLWYFLLGMFTYSMVYTACVLLVLPVPKTYRIVLLSPALVTALVPSFVDVYVFSFVHTAGVGLERLTKDVEEVAHWTVLEVKAVADRWLRIDSLLRTHNKLFSYLLFIRLVVFMTQGMASLFSLTTLNKCEYDGSYIGPLLIPLLESIVRFFCVCVAGNYFMKKHEDLLESLRAVRCEDTLGQHPLNLPHQRLHDLMSRMEASPLEVEIWGMECLSSHTCSKLISVILTYLFMLLQLQPASTFESSQEEQEL